jgi:hypothetical protein
MLGKPRLPLNVLLLVFALLACGALRAAEPVVTVHLLDPTGKRETKARFWIDWSKAWRGIVTTRAATPEQAKALVALCRTSLVNEEAEHFCGHDPVYGIEATSADGKALKTSLCFSCLTWVKPGKRLSIAGERGVGNELCKALRAVIELPPELLEAGDK